MARHHFLQSTLLSLYTAVYEHLARPLIFRRTPQQAHEQAMSLLRWLDNHNQMQAILRNFRRVGFAHQPVEVGGVTLPHPFILAAGFVKGLGFASDDEACRAVAAGQNIIPGWRSMPALVGAVEIGSFTRWTRLGNDGTTLWRDEATRSLQNRVGLKNPGASAAAEFLAIHAAHLPSIFGLNIAPSPGVTDPEQEQSEILEALTAFLSRVIKPNWFTLNLSCPNTEDDPGSRQTASRARNLCSEVIDHLRPTGIPLWVKISPALAAHQYQTLMRVFAETGVRAVIATNTLGEPLSSDPDVVAGVGGSRLRHHALNAVRLLAVEKEHSGAVDIIGCGGILNGADYREFVSLGVKAMQYWTALIYRGPLAAALIQREANRLGENRNG